MGSGDSVSPDYEFLLAKDSKIIYNTRIFCPENHGF
jgi:hypothetical protein